MEMPASPPLGRKPRNPPAYRDLSAALRDAGFTPAEGASAQAVRARVVAALSTFLTGEMSRVQSERLERQHTIITRCDLGGQLHKVVAADLGISMRTFYRERRDGFARLRCALLTLPEQTPVVQPIAGDDLARRIERAWEQASLGRIREAIVRLEEIVAGAPPALLAVACARLAGARFLANGDAATGEALVRARRALAMLGPGAASAVAEAEIRIVEALDLECAGAFERALQLHERVALDLRSGAPHAVDTSRRAVLARIEAHTGRGDAARALEIALDARGLVGGEGAPAAFRTALDVAVAECTVMLGSQMAAARNGALELQATAASRGEVLLAARTLQIAAQASLALFDREGGLAHARAALALAREVHAARLGAAMLLELAGTFAELGDGETALALAEERAAERERDDFFAGVVRLREADALVALGQHREAAEQAAQAVRILSRFSSRRRLGEAFLASSRAGLGRGDSRGSRTMALHAYKLLRGASWPTRTARAARLAGRRTGWQADPEGHSLSSVFRAG